MCRKQTVAGSRRHESREENHTMLRGIDRALSNRREEDFSRSKIQLKGRVEDRVYRRRTVYRQKTKKLCNKKVIQITNRIIEKVFIKYKESDKTRMKRINIWINKQNTSKRYIIKNKYTRNEKLSNNIQNHKIKENKKDYSRSKKDYDILLLF